MANQQHITKTMLIMNAIKLPFLSLLMLLMLGCTSTKAQQTSDAKFEIAPNEYAELAEKAVRHVEKFAWQDFYGMLSDDTELYLPDGGPKTRTAFKGKEAVMAFWNSYKTKSGNSKIVTSDHVHLPVISKEEVAYTKLTGVIVISYFTLDMTYGKEVVNLRMNWAMHFNADKKIDRIYTYYDRTLIIAAAKKNLLSKGEE